MRKIAFCFHLTDYNSNICFNRLLVNVKRAFIIFSCVLRDSTTRYVGPSVGWSVGWLVSPLFTFLAFLSFLSIRLLPRCPSDLLQDCSYPPAHDQGSRVSGLAQCQQAFIASLPLPKCFACLQILSLPCTKCTRLTQLCIQPCFFFFISHPYLHPHSLTILLSLSQSSREKAIRIIIEHFQKTRSRIFVILKGHSTKHITEKGHGTTSKNKWQNTAIRILPCKEKSSLHRIIYYLITFKFGF